MRIDRFSKILVLSVLCSLLGGSLFTVMGQDVIRASGGTEISIDNVGGAYSTLSGPTIRETAAGQLAEGGTIVLTLPDGYEWNTNLTVQEEATDADDGEAPGPEDVTFVIESVGTANTDLAIEFTSLSTSEFIISITSVSELRGQGRGPGRLTINGLQLRPTNTSVPNTGQISNTGTTGPTANYGDLSTKMGALQTVQVETAANGSGEVVAPQNLRAANNLTVYSIGRDAGNNFINNVALDDESDWSLINTTGNVLSTALTVANDRRSATLNSQLTGTTQIQAVRSGANTTPSETITITPRPASKMQIQIQPASIAVAGEVFDTQPVIRLFDQFGNHVTTDNETEVTTSINSGDGTLSGTLTQTATGGEIPFTDLSSQIANDITLLFQSNGLSNVVSDVTTINPNTAVDLSFIQQPTNTVRNTTISPPVEVQLLDKFGNNVSESGISITISDETFFTNNATLTAVTDVNGIAIFDDLRIWNNATEGDYNLTASITGFNAPVQSNIFSIISADNLTKFEVTDLNGNPLGEQEAGISFDILITARTGDNQVFENFSDAVEVTADSDISVNGSTVTSFTSDNFTEGTLETTITLTSSGDTRIYVENNVENRVGQSNLFSIVPTIVEFTNTVLSANPTEITANGSSTSQITVQLRDQFENNLITGGESITIETAAGSLGDNPEDGTSASATDEGDGTYTTTLTSSTSIETATITALKSGVELATTDVQFTAGTIAEFHISIPLTNGEPTPQTAGIEFLVAVEAVDQNGNKVSSYSGELTFSSNSVISSGETAQITNGLIEDHPITLTQSGNNVTLTVEDLDLFDINGISEAFQVMAGTPDLTKSNVLANPTVIQNDGASSSTIIVILRDEFSNRVLNNQVGNLSLSVEQIEEGGTASSGKRDQLLGDLTFNSGNSSYQATLTSTNTAEVVEITATFSGEVLNQIATVSIVVPKLWDPGGGPSAQDWIDDGNWSPEGQPTADDFVVIPGGLNNYPDLDINPTIGSLEIQDGGQLILFGGNTFQIVGSVIVDGSFDTEDNTILDIGGNFTGTGTFVSGAGTTIEVQGDINIDNFLARTDGTILKMNGGSQQTLSSINFLITRLEILNNVLVTSGDVLDTSELFIDEGSTLELQQDAGIALDNIQNIFGSGSLILNNNTLVVRGDLNVPNIDTSEGSVVFGVRVGENFADYPDLQQQQITDLSQMRNAIINNIEGVRTFDDVIIGEDGTLTLENGELIIGSGRNFIASNVTYNNGSLTFLRSISQPGWRLLSSPITNSYENWFDGLTLQGMENTNFSDRQPNLLFYDETFIGTDNQRWRTPGDATENLTPGRGYFFYVFGDVEADGDYDDTLPQTLTVSGQENAAADNSPFDLNVTYTAKADTGFNLVGNPFGATINWDDDSWVKENMDNVIYIWDQSNNQYRTWNGVAGSHNSGNIAPFQGFWVKANIDNPSLQISREAKATDGVFRKSQRSTVDHQWPVIEMQVEGAEMQHSTHFTFTENGRNNIDNMDAYRLLPFDTNTYLEIFTLMEDGTELSITNLPRKFGKTIKLPLHVSGVKDGAFIDNTISLSWPKLINIPDGWTITLLDNDTNKRVNLMEENFYDFTLNERAKAPPVMNTTSNFRLVEKSMAKKQNARFTIEINPGADAEGIPAEVELNQNFANPFSHTTTIQFGLPVEQRAKIEVYDVLGRRIQIITDQRYSEGYHEVEFNGRSLASGVYFYRLVTEEKTIVKKMTLIK